MYAIASSAIFKMHVILIQLDNIKDISESYLDFHDKLRNSKKIKIVGKLFLKLFIITNQRGIDNKNFQNSLLQNSYMLTDLQIQGLENALTNFDLLKINLAHQLICYGEKNNF
jgi:histidinol phosphatase-like enzyme